MGTRKVTTCDRCGKEFKWIGVSAGYFINGIRKCNNIHFRVIHNGNIDGYSYGDQRVDLCQDCTRKLLEFLKGNKDLHEI